LARKIAAITLLVWKKGVRFDAEQLKQQAAERLVRTLFLRWIHVWRRSVGLLALWFEGEYPLAR